MDHPPVPAPWSGDDDLDTDAPSGNGTRPRPSQLDPVDLAWLAARPRAEVQRSASRWVALAFVVVLFVVLLVLGAWLAARARSSGPAVIAPASALLAVGDGSGSS
ncbi:MAG TPA: hypothetical protein VKU86_04340 [Acidimicrobiales bacterium]|nr:hypothetical protein [Acidimicrobiales bacterium]